MKENTRIVKNADNETLMPLGNKGWIVGYVDEVNGSGATEVSGFVPTRFELIQLAEYWERYALEIEWFWFITGVVSSAETGQTAFARSRVNRIWDLIGKEEVQQAIDRAYAEFGKDQEPRLWDIFLHGDEAARRAVPEETWRQVEEEDSRRQAEPGLSRATPEKSDDL
jgi:hypothetical protein